MLSDQITLIEAAQVAEVLSKNEGREYHFIRFMMKFSRPAILFETSDRDQKILTVASAKSLLNNKVY